MLTRTHMQRIVLALGAAAVAASTVHAQCLTSPRPGREIRQISRNITGSVKPGKSVLNPTAGSVAILYNCQPTSTQPPLRSRQVFYGQLELDFSAIVGCDEVKSFVGTLRGDYHSVMRLNDPIASTVTNPRIGRHDARGFVMDPAGNRVGTFTMRGTISANPSRPPIEPAGGCYECLRHEGVLTVRLNQSPVFVSAPAYITASYEWNSDPINYECNTGEPCEFAFALSGTLDGIVEADCGTIRSE